MTRKEAIQILWQYDVNFEPHPAEEVMHAIDMAIEALKAQEWIPCSERLPNETGTMKGYLVSIGEVVTIMAFVGGHFVEPVNGRLVQPDYPVQAWMGLPKPYREDGEA